MLESKEISDFARWQEGVGAGISIENKIGDAKKHLEERLESVNRAMEKLQKSAYAINEKLLEIEEQSKELKIGRASCRERV